ncbi:PREDICTED: uncharacterized protein LOC109132434 [Camelina sativa]|uniref:Uncharacterized protein LOC109132434 n=1 Tax=Camelina sativa TaxID=90675 RepID=A0ABM1RKP9_CAMSA|nr:PREDICTED: uncharacterized protein LOC109132434 [Camelina sativa]
MLNLRQFAIKFLKARLGNGTQISFWYDDWTPYGPLIEFLGPTGPYQTGIPLRGKVGQACSASGWRFRPARSTKVEELQIYLTTIEPPILSSLPDNYYWQIGSEKLQQFSTSKTWEAIRPAQVPPTWARQVWFKGAIPRHAFMMWLMNLDRLPTRERLVQWGYQIEEKCCLCGLMQETRDHLFLRCEVSEELWVGVTSRIGYRPFSFHTWAALSAWLDVGDDKAPKNRRRLVAQATLYVIWQERNSRFHNHISTDVRVLFKGLDRLIKDALLAKQRRKKFRDSMGIWLKYTY